MSPVEEYLRELGAALRVRGRRRRRILAECREHLADAARERGPSAAVAAFGPAAELAAALDLESAAQRGLRATWLSAGGVAATAGSTLVLLHAADPGARGPWPLAVAFFVFAQLAAVAILAGLAQGLSLRERTPEPAELALLARRNLTGALAAGLTMVAAGAALLGRGSALGLLAGPAVLAPAIASALHARRLARRLPAGTDRVTDNPVAAVLSWRPLRGLARAASVVDPVGRPVSTLLLVGGLAGSAAFARELGEGATPAGAGAAAAIEAAAVAVCFAALGPALGLRSSRSLARR